MTNSQAHADAELESDGRRGGEGAEAPPVEPQEPPHEEPAPKSPEPEPRRRASPPPSTGESGHAQRRPPPPSLPFTNADGCGRRPRQRPGIPARGHCRSSTAPPAQRGPSPPGAEPRRPSGGSGRKAYAESQIEMPTTSSPSSAYAGRPPPARPGTRPPPGLLEPLPRVRLDPASAHPEVAVHPPSWRS
jgi:hypothetical protein